MPLALLFPVLVGLFLLAMEGFEAWVLGPLHRGTGGSAPPGKASRDRVRTYVHRRDAGRPIEGRLPWT